MNDYMIFDGYGADCSLSYYGGYRTRTFADIFPSFEEFEQEYTANGLAVTFSSAGKPGLTLSQFYYMMYAHYGNSHIAYSDENQFKYYMYSIIYQYGPNAIRKREIQDELRALDESEIREGSTAIYNHAYNPSTAPSTSTLDELLTINDQNTQKRRRSALEGYGTLLSLLGEDVIDDFIHKFRRLFIKVTAPDYPLLYTTEVQK